jgi:hypothetical protein
MAASSVVAVSALAALPQTAMAQKTLDDGGESATCPGRECGVYSDFFPGGTVSVDVDLHGNGPAQWGLYTSAGLSCSASFRAEEGPRSWICYNVPSGTIELDVFGGAGTGGPSSVGMRW